MEIYIADLGAYTAGELKGEWFDLNDYTDAGELNKAVDAWKQENGVEEIAVHDYDDCPAHDEFGEHPDFEELFTYHTLYEKYGDSFATWFDLRYSGGSDCYEWEDKYNDENMGEWESWEDLAQYLIDECGVLGDLPEQVKPYIDYSAFARDLRCNGEYIEQNGYFFRNY